MVTSILPLISISGLIYLGHGAQIQPTITNSSGDYYITSKSTPNDYQFDTLTCSSSNCHIICDGVSSCYSLNIDAQYSTSLTLQCTQINACYKLHVITSSTSTSLACHNINACYDVHLIANSLSSLQIECSNGKETDPSHLDAACNGLTVLASNIANLQTVCHAYDCYKSTFDMNHVQIANFSLHDHAAYRMTIYASQISQLLNMDCTESYSCLQSQIYCPFHGTCSIICPTNASCHSTDIFIPNHQYQTLHFDCNNSINDSCQESNIHCMNSNGVTDWYYSVPHNEWKCDNFECCPFNDGTLSCDAEDDCVINCTSTTCTNRNINASVANSLELYCNGFEECQGALVVCPDTKDASCDIVCSDSSSCSYSIMHGLSQTFSLICSAENSCEWSEISLLNESDIICSGSNSCTNMNITFDLWSDYRIKGVALSCLASSSCSSLQMDMAEVKNADTMTVACNGMNACYDLNIIAPNVSINTLDIDCVGTEIDTCKYLDISATVGDSLNAYCGYRSSCAHSVFWFTMKATAITAILCSNQYVTDQNVDGSCYNATFHLMPYNADYPVHDVYIKCNKYDCYGARFNVDSEHQVLVDCTSPNSCDSSTISADQAETLTVNCEAPNACQDMNIFCPYHSVSACAIHCGEYAHSCYSMDIHSSDAFVYNYLNLTYSIALNKDIYWKGYITFDCVQKSDVRYEYNEYMERFICDETGLDSHCCPFLKLVHPCDDGDEECIIDCEWQSCSNSYINGSNANKLILNCHYCMRSIILCPNDGCVINTGDDDGARLTDSKVHYNGTQLDNAILAIHCHFDMTCNNLHVYASNVSTLIMTALIDADTSGVTVHAEFANNITIETGGGRLYGACSGYGCRYFSNGFQSTYIYATYAKYIYIKALAPWGFRNSHLVAEYAESVTILATGNDGWKDSVLIATHAQSVTIKCISGMSGGEYNEIETPCDAAIWHVGASNTEFSCYGYGCRELGTISTEEGIDSVDIMFNMNCCKDGCESLNENQWITSAELWCDNQYDKYVNLDEKPFCEIDILNQSGYASAEQCGCSAFDLKTFDRMDPAALLCANVNYSFPEVDRAPHSSYSIMLMIGVCYALDSCL